MDKRITTKNAVSAANRSNIYHYMYSHALLSRQDIAYALRLSLPTVTQDINELIGEGLIETAGKNDETGGRHAVTYSIVPDARLAIGLEINKHHIAAAVVDLQGNIRYKIRIRRLFERSDTYYRYLGSMVDTAVKSAGIDASRILGVGIGVPGLVTPDNNRITYGKILDLNDVGLEEFSRYIPFPTLLFNDANAAGLAEMWANGKIANAFYIMLSSNIGGSIIINHQVYDGEDFRSGEIGHLQIVPGGKACYCGQHGCMDAYCASSVLSDTAGGKLEEFFRLLKCGDEKAEKVWSEYLDHLAFAINMIRMLFDCQIILGGYVGAYIDTYLPDLKKRVMQYNPFDKTGDFLVSCIRKEEAIASGTALSFISDFLKTI
jgi:predicted NBD/HSP70 family sugar kinase